MPMDGVALSSIARELHTTLVGGRVDKVTQPERDEIHLLVRNNGQNHALLLCANANCARVHLTHVKRNNPLEPPLFCMLMRKHLIGARIKNISQINGDRILTIDIETRNEIEDVLTKSLIIEIMGKHSNIIFVGENGRIIDAAHHVDEAQSRVREVLPGLRYEYPPAQDKLMPCDWTVENISQKIATGQRLDTALAQAIMGISTPTARELAMVIAGDETARVAGLDMTICATRALKWLTQNAVNGPAVLIEDENGPIDALPCPSVRVPENMQKTIGSMSYALDELYEKRDAIERLRQKSSALSRVLKNNVERCEKKLSLQHETLEQSKNVEDYRINGELITANLPKYVKGSTTLRAVNYYDENLAERDITLETHMTGPQNAQRYFKLYQKAKSAGRQAQERIDTTDAELTYLEGQLYNLAACETEAELSELRQELEKQGYVRANHNRKQLKQLAPSQPHHFVSSQGIDIFVGKNNRQNDALTANARGDDVWLHTKDIPGSHVIIRSATPPRETLLEAAMLAAYYSKAGTSSNVPVDYAQRKHVKKPSGSPPGFVIYTNQNTLYVTPDSDKLLKPLV